MRFAQYGISHDHAAGKARVIRESAQAELAGVYEPSPQVRDTLGSDPAYEGVHWFSSKEEMLEDDGIAAIAAEGEIFQNVGFAREAVEHGKHVWLDKPAGDDLDAFRWVVEIARERGLMVQLSYMWRYHPGFRFIMEWARSGRLGEVFSIRGRISSWPGSEDRWKLWDSRGVRAGGIMFIVGCHLIDIIVAILGRPRRVTRFSRHDGGDPPWFPDNTAAVFEYTGAMATVESAYLEVSSVESRRLEVYGTRGSAILEPFEPPALRLCLDRARDGYAKGWQTVPIPHRRRYYAGLDSLLAAIRGDSPPERSLDHELTVQDTLLRAIGLA